MYFYCAIQSTYISVELGLFTSNKTQSCIETHVLDKKEASKMIIPTLDALFKKHSFHLSDLSFCAVNAGPGPFTTLRTVITTVNGLSFATGVPLFGINALEALINFYDLSCTKNVIALLNAFGGDVYFALRSADSKEIIIGVGPLEKVIQHMDAHSQNQTWHIIGGAAPTHQDSFAHLGNRVTIIPDLPHAPLSFLAHYGLELFNKGKSGTRHIKPIYLKNHPAATIK